MPRVIGLACRPRLHVLDAERVRQPAALPKGGIQLQRVADDAQPALAISVVPTVVQTPTHREAAKGPRIARFPRLAFIAAILSARRAVAHTKCERPTAAIRVRLLSTGRISRHARTISDTVGDVLRPRTNIIAAAVVLSRLAACNRMAENIGVDQCEQFLVLFDGLRANALPRMTNAIVETAIGARGGESRYKSDEHREREKRRRTCVAPYQALYVC